MSKPVQRNRSKRKKIVACENCINCMYEGSGDMYCDIHERFPYVYEDFCPTENYMWCQGKKFQEI